MAFASGRRLFAAALSSLLLAGFLMVPAVPADATPTSSGSGNCVLIDTDFDIDDMMAIPAVIGNRPVAAIVISEGYTRPKKGAAALSRLVAEPGQRNIPIIVGAGKNRSDASIISKWGEFVLDYRGMMNRLNDFLPVALPPSPSVLPSYKKQVVAAVAGCQTVDILVIGTFTSFVHYSPLIRSKIGEVVIMGKPLRGDKSQRPGNFSFNCEYDMAACRYASNKQLPGLNYAFVDVPRTHCDETPNTGSCAGTVYGPTLSMVQSLTSKGLPNALKQVLLNHPSSWALDGWETSGFGGKTLLWDQSASLYLLDHSIFKKVGGRGGHYETTLMPDPFRKKWTKFTNKSVVYKTNAAIR